MLLSIIINKNEVSMVHLPFLSLFKLKVFLILYSLFLKFNFNSCLLIFCFLIILNMVSTESVNSQLSTTENKDSCVFSKNITGAWITVMLFITIVFHATLFAISYNKCGVCKFKLFLIAKLSEI